MTDEKTSTLTPAMKVVVGVVAVLVVAGIITVSVLLSNGKTPGLASAVTTTGQQSGDTAGRPGAASPSRGSSMKPSTGTTKTDAPDPTRTWGSEGIAPTATFDPRLPTISPAAPLVKAPLPKPATRTGGLVSGFPTNVVGPAAKSTVLSSSIATQKTTMQVSLVATSTTSQDTVQKHYEKLWASLGLQQGITSDGTVLYTGAHESVALSFGSSGTGTRYTIYGVFRTK